MCGIIGYSGKRDAGEVILAALTNLEYRGYDSAGMAVWQEDGIHTIKCGGRLGNLKQKSAEAGLASGCGIGHTRWATHGEPNDTNSHPHSSGGVTLVHNGIIENYLELREKLAAEGYEFVSQTDTEIAAAMLDFLARSMSPLEAVAKSEEVFEGSYAFVVLFASEPDTIYGIRRGSPLIAARDDTGAYVASDVPAVIQYTRDYYLLDEGEIAVIKSGALSIFTEKLQPAQKQMLTAGWSVEQAQKGGYDYFMLKEIFEQPQALHNTVSPRLHDGLPTFLSDGLPDGFFAGIDRLHISACGTALHSGMVGKALIESISRLPVDVEVASELRYCDPILNRGEAALVISQSGETADSLAALRLFKEAGIPVIAIVNVVGSSIAREADYCLYTFAGPEIAVASTKAYSVQIAMMYLLAFRIALERGRISPEECRGYISSLMQTIELTPKVLELKDEINAYARTLKETDHLFYIGRGYDYSLAMEGSLKLKEISYIHSEAYAAGELKHGTISLVTDGVPVIALATQRTLFGKMISNIKEVKARGARVLLVTTEDAEPDPAAYDDILRIPAVADRFTPLLQVIILQLISAYAAIYRGCDVDKPRNLAKSVTVE